MFRVRLRPERFAAVSPCSAPDGVQPRRLVGSSVLVVVLAACGGLLGACADDPLGDLKAPLVTGTAGRQRFVVTLVGAAPDLTEYRRLLKDDPARVPAYVDDRRAAMLRPDFEAAIAGVNGRVVERWWMSGQLTVELASESVASIRALAGVASVDPDVPLH